MASRAISFVELGQDVQLNLLEATAKQAYCVWAHRVGTDTPWEHLPVTHQTAWKEVVEVIQDEPECEQCGEVLLCVICDSRDIYTCPACTDHPLLRCPHCGWNVEEEELDAVPRASEGDTKGPQACQQEGGS